MSVPARERLQFPGAPHTVSRRLRYAIALAVGFALLLAVAALVFTEVRTFRATALKDATGLAEVLSMTTAAAVAFDDPDTARQHLATLRVRPAVLGAAIYRDGRLFAEYRRPRAPAFPAVLSGEREDDVEDGIVEVFEDVRDAAGSVGVLQIRSELRLGGRLREFVPLLLAIAVLSLGAALLLSNRLTNSIRRPLEAVAAVAHEVTTTRSYHARARVRADGELAVVVDAFNSMLDEIEARTRALRASEETYRGIGESLAYGVWITDGAGRAQYISESFLELIGLTLEQAAEFGWAHVLHPDDREATLRDWAACVASGGPWYREHRFLGVDGRYHPILAQGVAIRDEHGTIVRWAGINLDISRLKSTEEALRDADRRKDEFLAVLAHELRNPLAPIRHAARLLEMPGADEARRRWGREVIGRQVSRMALLLDDLLDVSRITRGKLDLRRAPVALETVVTSAVETAQPLIDSKSHRLTIDLPEVPVTLDVDALRLSQAVSNLLTNAAKYTDASGRIALRATLDDGVVISVEDNGIGIAPEAQPYLFEIFSQVHEGRERNDGGLGIGLSLVKGLVALHGGTVSVHSAGAGRGSRFTIRLPADLIVRNGRTGVATHPATLALPSRAARVLVADDNRDAADALAAVLRLEGHDVHVVYSGQEALLRAEALRPRAILLDIGMPGMDGYEVARRVRSTGWGRSVHLAALTGWGQVQDQEKAHRSGFDRHFTKPADPEALAGWLASQLAASEPRPGSGAHG